MLLPGSLPGGIQRSNRPSWDDRVPAFLQTALGRLGDPRFRNDFLPTFLGMEAEILAPVATSPLDFARGRGKHRHRPIGAPSGNTITTIRIEISKDRRIESCGSIRTQESSPKVGFHVQ